MCKNGMNMISWYFSFVTKPGKYIINYLVNKQDHEEEVILFGKDSEDLREKWNLFALSNGVSVNSVTWVEMAVA